MSSRIVTRFAPSPTGFLHLGHAYSAMFGFDVARENGGRFLVRIENIDFTRCRVEFEQGICEDLQWLGLEWESPVRRQSEHLSDYLAVAEQLRSRGLLYPCFCTRKDIQREIDAAGGAPHGLEGPLYPGTCRSLSEDERQSRIAAGESCALRLDVDRAIAEVGSCLEWNDLERGVQRAEPQKLGDVVLVRKDIGCSYHLAVVVDDALQEVTRVTRGEDLFDATHLQRLLQALLGLKTPEYQHHPLLCDSNGKRLAKRDEAETLRSLRHRGVSPAEVHQRLRFNKAADQRNDACRSSFFESR
jgi:glutamyl-Q tRNA(Asp) synthetase